jgi:hypothetical protein
MVHLGVLYDAATSAPKRQISIHNGVKNFQEQILLEPGLDYKGQGFRSSSIHFKLPYSMAHYNREIGLKRLTFRGLTSSRGGDIIEDTDQQENILRPKGMSVLFYGRPENKFAHLPQNLDM